MTLLPGRGQRPGPPKAPREGQAARQEVGQRTGWSVCPVSHVPSRGGHPRALQGLNCQEGARSDSEAGVEVLSRRRVELDSLSPQGTRGNWKPLGGVQSRAGQTKQQDKVRFDLFSEMETINLLTF